MTLLDTATLEDDKLFQDIGVEPLSDGIQHRLSGAAR